MNELPIKNTGLIPEITENAWLGGKIPYQVNLESADWTPFDVEHETQNSGGFDEMDCVTRSLLNNLEVQHKFKGIDINLSDRFTAKVSDTQKNGNTFERVADSCRASSSKSVGAVYEHLWPNKPPAKTWEEFYKTIDQEVLKKAFKIDFNYEFVPRSTDWADTLRHNLKQSPLWITWPKDPYHAMTLMRIYPDNIYGDVKDHYTRSIKKIKVADIALAARVVINKYINMNDNIVIYKIGSEYQLAQKAKSEEGFAQQLFSAGASNLLTSEGKPNFVEIDKIAKTL